MTEATDNTVNEDEDDPASAFLASVLNAIEALETFTAQGVEDVLLEFETGMPSIDDYVRSLVLTYSEIKASSEDRYTPQEMFKLALATLPSDAASGYA